MTTLVLVALGLLLCPVTGVIIGRSTRMDDRLSGKPYVPPISSDIFNISIFEGFGTSDASDTLHFQDSTLFVDMPSRRPLTVRDSYGLSRLHAHDNRLITVMLRYFAALHEISIDFDLGAFEAYHLDRLEVEWRAFAHLPAEQFRKEVLTGGLVGMDTPSRFIAIARAFGAAYGETILQEVTYKNLTVGPSALKRFGMGFSAHQTAQARSVVDIMPQNRVYPSSPYVSIAPQWEPELKYVGVYAMTALKFWRTFAREAQLTVHTTFEDEFHQPEGRYNTTFNAKRTSKGYYSNEFKTIEPTMEAVEQQRLYALIESLALALRDATSPYVHCSYCQISADS